MEKSLVGRLLLGVLSVLCAVPFLMGFVSNKTLHLPEPSIDDQPKFQVSCSTPDSGAQQRPSQSLTVGNCVYQDYWPIMAKIYLWITTDISHHMYSSNLSLQHLDLWILFGLLSVIVISAFAARCSHAMDEFGATQSQWSRRELGKRALGLQ